MTAPHYCTSDQAAALALKDPALFADEWFDWVDAQIEEYNDQGYKGATRTAIYRGDGNSLLRLPSKAQTITQITEDGSVMGTDLYEFDPPPSRNIERVLASPYALLYGNTQGSWARGRKYIVTYVEPTLLQAPPKEVAKYQKTAAECLKIIELFTEKSETYGIALTVSEGATAGGGRSGVSTIGSRSFPASMLEEIKRAITNGMPKARL